MVEPEFTDPVEPAPSKKRGNSIIKPMQSAVLQNKNNCSHFKVKEGGKKFLI